MSLPFVEKLKSVFASHKAIDLAQFQLINLDLVRQGTGEHWDRLRAKIFSVSQHFIEKRVAGDDIVIRCDEGFIILFASEDGAMAERRTREISGELNQFFLGDELLKKLEVRSQAMKLNPKNLDSFLRSQAAEGLGTEAGTARPSTRDEEEETEPQPNVPHTAIRPALRSESVVYKPVWDAEREIVFTQFSVMKLCESRVSKPFYGAAALRGDYSPRRFLELDLKALRQTGQSLQGDGDGDPPVTSVVLPVHFDTLSTLATRQEYFRTLADLPEEMRSRILIGIARIDSGTPASRIEDVLRSIRPLSKNLMVQRPYGDTDISRFEACNVSAFGWQMPPRSRGFVFSVAEQAKLRTFVKNAFRQRAATYLIDLPSFAALQQAIRCRVRFFQGEFIVAESDVPVLPFRLDQATIENRAEDEFLV